MTGRTISGSPVLKNGWVLVALLASIVAALGGSSRVDAVQIVALRPLAALFLIPAIYWVTRPKLSSVKVPLALMCGLAGLMVVQLVPLPPMIWHMLPGREPIIALSAAMEIDASWRPLSVVPSRTYNALASLIVPFVGLLLATSLGARQRVLLSAIAIIGVTNAALSILQIMGPATGPLYFYDITNFGTPVGLFANQNHSAVFSALTLLVLGYLIALPKILASYPWVRMALVACFIFVLVAGLIGGSRAGFLGTMLALIGTAIMVRAAMANSNSKRSTKLPEIFGFRLKPAFLLAGSAVVIFAVFVAFFAADRLPAIGAFAGSDELSELRFALLPTMQNMLSVYWLPGAGFGSFEEVFHMFTPDELMRPSYLNQAHNDLIQLVLEGGVAALLLVGALLWWFGKGLLHLRNMPKIGFVQVIFWIVLLAIILMASAADYPVRTPIFQLSLVFFLVTFCRDIGDEARAKVNRSGDGVNAPN